MNNAVSQGKHPGELFIQGYGPILAVSWDEGLVYDQVDLTTASGAATVAAGSEMVFFRDITAKNNLETNMQIQSQLPSGWEMIVLKVGIHVPTMITCSGNVTATQTEFEQLLRYGYAELKLDNTFVAKSGLIPMFGDGYGIHGSVSVGHTSAATAQFFNNGLPSFSAHPNLRIPIVITDKRTFQGTIHFYDQLTFNGNDTTVAITMYLYGFIRQPAQ